MKSNNQPFNRKSANCCCGTRSVFCKQLCQLNTTVLLAVIDYSGRVLRGKITLIKDPIPSHSDVIWRIPRMTHRTAYLVRLSNISFVVTDSRFLSGQIVLEPKHFSVMHLQSSLFTDHIFMLESCFKLLSKRRFQTFSHTSCTD